MTTDKTAYIKSNKPLYISNLVARMNNNEQFGEYDFEAWVFSHIECKAGCELMDVACGNGKAILKLLRLHPQLGKVVGVDFAETAIKMLADEAQNSGSAQKVEALLLDMEKISQVLSDRRFDHIFSVYGIHYSPRMVELLCEYKALLKPGGTIFVCGPDAFCNTKVMRILAGSDVINTEPIAPRMLKPFISQGQINTLRNAFAKVELDYLENPIRFPDLESFLTWWRNHDLYREELEGTMQARIEQEIAERGDFTLNKNVLGVKLYV